MAARRPPARVSTIRDLTADPKNARRHSARNLEAIATSLRKVGTGRSIVIDERNVVLAGNGTIKAAAEVGIDKVRVIDAKADEIIAVRRSDLSKQQKAELAVYDNRSAEFAEWDGDALKALTQDGLDLGQLFTNAEMKALELLDATSGGGTGDADAIPAQRRTAIKEGHLFALGQHRLLCGDSTRIETADRVLNARKADLVFTDPPYGVNVTGKGGDSIAGDISFTAIPLMFDVLDGVLAAKAWCYVCGGQSNAPLYGRMFERYFRQLPRIIVWDKGRTAVMRQAGYHSCFEFIYFSFKDGGGGRWFGGRDSDAADDIWRARVEHGEARVHLTQKPVALPLRAITNTCPDGGLVFEPFCGSGSTLMAAEQAKRPCAAIEIDPRYCQVIIDRWEAFTGQKATKLGEVA